MEQLLAALFQLFEPTHLAFLFAGTLLGLIVGILPGMGGTSGLALVLPFVFTNVHVCFILEFWRNKFQTKEEFLIYCCCVSFC